MMFVNAITANNNVAFARRGSVNALPSNIRECNSPNCPHKPKGDSKGTTKGGK